MTTCDTATIELVGVPPSINTNTVRSHWRGFHTAKKTWQREIELRFQHAQLPRPLPAIGPVQAVATLHFPTRRRRDSENFRPVLSKSLGDALVNGGWLVDDTDEDWWLRLVIAREPTAPKTVITLTWESGLEDIAA